MSQQHAQFEEEFRDGPQPAYHSGYSGPQPTPDYQPGYSMPQPASYTASVPPNQSYVNVPGQKLLAYDLSSGRAPGVGARLALSILSLIFTFIMFIVALAIVGSSRFDPFPMIPLTIVFALIFAGVVLIINLIFSRRH